MGLKKTAGKLTDYRKRFEAGKARKIKRADVEKVIAKLDAHERELRNRIESTEKPSKRDRLMKKLAAAQDLKAQAAWLLNEIT